MSYSCNATSTLDSHSHSHSSFGPLDISDLGPNDLETEIDLLEGDNTAWMTSTQASPAFNSAEAPVNLVNLANPEPVSQPAPATQVSQLEPAAEVSRVSLPSLVACSG